MNTDDITPTAQPVEIWRGTHSDPDNLFGPLPGLQIGDVVAYEFELPERFVPAPGRTRIERTFVLLDVGVSFANPFWFNGIEADTWYVDLIAVQQNDQRYTFLDLYIDAFVPTNGRHYRQLDLDEFADAITDGKLSLPEAVDGLRRWQQFLDRYLHADRWPPVTWTDFPPASIKQLREIVGPFATPVRYKG